MENGGTVVAHNAFFEMLIWEHVWKRYFPQLPELKIEQTVCTMVKCYALGLPGSLEKASAALGIDDKKDSKGQRIMLQLSQPQLFTPKGEPLWWDTEKFKEKYDRMYAYCAQDIVVEREIDKRTPPLSKDEQEMWYLDWKINQRGVAVDLTSAHVAIEIVREEQKRLNKEMQKVTQNQVATTNAHAQLTKWLKICGVKDVDGVGKSDVLDLLEDKSLPNDCRKALEIRQEAAKSSTAKLSALLQRTNKEDGRMRSTTQFNGAGTGRWAGRGFQTHNLPRPKLTENEIEGVFNVLLQQEKKKLPSL